jgi:heat-inducible transcriptional repressor
MDLTERQIQIIKTIVEEFTETAEAVGSVTLENKYRLGVSPATLRNEMAVLEEKGFLSQPHTSAGRVPTPMAIKFYVNELMKEKDLSVAEEVNVKSRVWDHRYNRDDLLREATKVLSERTSPFVSRPLKRVRCITPVMPIFLTKLNSKTLLLPKKYSIYSTNSNVF